MTDLQATARENFERLGALLGSAASPASMCVVSSEAMRRGVTLSYFLVLRGFDVKAFLRLDHAYMAYDIATESGLSKRAQRAVRAMVGAWVARGGRGQDGKKEAKSSYFYKKKAAQVEQIKCLLDMAEEQGDTLGRFA